MNTSQTIGQIAGALSKAQAEIKNPAKDKTATIPNKAGGAGFKYSYSDFATALDSIRPVLTKHKIAFVQATRWEGNLVMLETRLIHESGEWLSNDYPVGNLGEPRTMGSALSYARRYSLFPMIGVQGEDDDDGEAARKIEPAPVERDVFGLAQGTKGASPDRPAYDKMAIAIRSAPTLKALTEWQKNNHAEIDKLRPEWVDELRIEFVDRKNELTKALAA